MSKLSEKEKKDYKLVAKILGVILRIANICCWVGVGGVVIATIASAIIAPNVKVNSDQKEISLFDRTASYQIKDRALEFGDENDKVKVENNTVTVFQKDEEVLSIKISESNIEEVEKFIENDLTKTLAVIPFVLVVVVVLLIFLALSLAHGAKLCFSIGKEEIPFTKDNITHAQKIFSYMLVGFVLSFVVDIILTIATGVSSTFSYEITSVATMFGAYIMVYVFKSGYELKGGDKKEKADK